MSRTPRAVKLARLRSPGELRGRLVGVRAWLPVDDRPASGPEPPLAAPLEIGGRVAGNRLAILPMEGWDGNPAGAPSALTRRRWLRFARSGAGLLFGMEAVAVREDGRANPRQLVLDAATLPVLAALRGEVAREVAAGLRHRVPDLGLAVRRSAFDLAPFRAGPGGVGVPEIPASGLPRPFGGDARGLGPDLAETHGLLAGLPDLGVELVCATAGSPSYTPHVQRPAFDPPSDGYLPPEDPLVGVARQVATTAELRRALPRLRFVGSAYSDLQEWFPFVAGAVVREELSDAVGLGRMALSDPELPADRLAGRPLARGRIGRSFSDCTTAPRSGLASGCCLLDPFHRGRPEARDLARAKEVARAAG